MANTKISALPAMTTLQGSELFTGLQGGANSNGTAAQIKAFSSSSKFVQTATVTVANTAAETTLLGTGVGSLVVKANTLVAGSMVSGTALGFHSAAGSPTIRLRVYANSTLLLDTGAVSSGNSTNATWEFRGWVTCRTAGSSGTVMPQGFYMESGGGANVFGMVNTSPVTLDTTIDQTINFTVQWGTASASNTISAAVVQIQQWGAPI